jgi:hypothetical protein
LEFIGELRELFQSISVDILRLSESDKDLIEKRTMVLRRLSTEWQYFYQINVVRIRVSLPGEFLVSLKEPVT